MSIFSWLILLGVNILQCTSELVSGGTFQINKRMNGHVIHILSNMGAKMCLRHCHRYKDCNAVNYLPQILKCQLLALTDQDDHLISDTEYMFGNMTNWNMDTESCYRTNPCQEDTRCLPTHSNGHACLTFVTPCTASPCIHGYCNITNAGYKCTCDEGYSGINCEFTPCTASPCIHGYCNITNAGYKCTCDEGYSGINCEFTPCTASPCIHGYCNITNAGYKCTCDEGYSGINCEFNPCIPNPCKNGGYCINVGGKTHICECNSNTTGANCQYYCTGSWVLFDTTCYYFTNGTDSWYNARYNCDVNFNGKIAEPDTVAKISFLRSRAMGFGTKFWLGGTDDSSEGSFKWTKSQTSITFTDWYPGEPNNGKGHGDQDCLCLSSVLSYRWDDLTCGSNNRYICEKPYV